jgi:hypothetical protein
MSQLHELVTALAAPWVVLSPRSGQLTGSGAEGVYARDRRILSRLSVTIDGREPIPVHAVERSAAAPSVRRDGRRTRPTPGTIRP